MAPTRVGIIGAAGETGSSVTKALLDDGSFEVVALTRPESLEKPQNKVYQARGATIRPFSINASHEELVSGLSDIEILILTLQPNPEAHPKQVDIAKAAKAAGVKRFIPCAWRTILPPAGLHMLREADEHIMHEVKLMKLPYTYIDVGSWYQLTVPELPSGKTSYLNFGTGNVIPGDGNVATALTDLADVGRYVARIIADDRTLNKYVFVFNELWTTNQVYSYLEEISGEKINNKTFQSEEQYRAQIASVPLDSQSLEMMAVKVMAQYAISWGIRGDNTPEYAKYLGYVTSKELYPDFEYMPFKKYAESALEGKASAVYPEKKAFFAAAGKANGSG